MAWWLLRRRVIDQALPAGSLRLARLAGAFCGDRRGAESGPVVTSGTRGGRFGSGDPGPVRPLCATTGPMGAGGDGAALRLGTLGTSDGWSVVLASLSVTPAVLRWAKSAERPWTQLLPLIIGPLAVFVVLLLAGSNVWLWWSQLAISPRTVATLGAGRGDAAARIDGRLQRGALPRVVLRVAIMGLLAYTRESPVLRVGLPRAAGLAASLAVLGLALTADKLPSPTRPRWSRRWHC